MVVRAAVLNLDVCIKLYSVSHDIVDQRVTQSLIFATFADHLIVLSCIIWLHGVPQNYYITDRRNNCEEHDCSYFHYRLLYFSVNTVENDTVHHAIYIVSL